MRFHTARLLRAFTITLPTIWFLYIILALFYMEDDLSDPSRDLIHEADLKAEKNPSNKDTDLKNDVTKRSQKRLRIIQAMKNLAAQKHGVINMEAPVPKVGENDKASKERNNIMIKEKDEIIDKSKNVLNHEHIDAADVNKAKDLDTLARAESDVRHGAGLGGVEAEDPYVDVTYPPYVETLPSGDRGQGPRGLSIHTDSLSKEEKKVYQEKWDKNQFNQYASDLIPVHRELPDFRSQGCREKEYSSVLPNFSVVIIFHNEAWSVLLRSVHSILDRTNSSLLVEIILVDDFSSMEHLKKPLDKYFRGHPKVKVVRSPERGGLIKARMLGFEVTKGDVVVFLDSHIECTPGWAEPMLWMISQDYRTVPFPLIDIISTTELSYSAHDRSPYGIFSMNTMTFKWSSQGQPQTRPQTEPKPSPTMPGGLFAISRKWFTELGMYDPELVYWGGENMELSFKVWMCGGSVVIAECSHVGHIFRAQNPIKWSSMLGNRNYVRVAMVWLDEYKNHYLERNRYRVGDYGDISERLAIRERLQCHNFAWYVENIYPNLKQQLVLNATYAGEVRHEQSGLCLDKMNNKHKGPQLFSCHKQGGNQFWYLRDDKYLQMENEFACKRNTYDSIHLCHESERQKWSYNPIAEVTEEQKKQKEFTTFVYHLCLPPLSTTSVYHL